MKKPRIAITGAGGFLGSKFSAHFTRKGFDVLHLTRSPPKNSKSKYVKFTLGEELDSSIFKDVDVLVHCAHDFKISDKKKYHDVNVKGSEKLFEAASKAKTHIIFISSVAAHQKAKSKYGKAKLATEKIAEKHQATIIRPALLFGKNAKSIVGTLVSLIRKLPVIPVVYAKQQMNACHYADLSEAVEKLANTKHATKIPIIAASQKSMEFQNMIKTIASAYGKKVLIIPLPFTLVYLPLKLLETIGIRTKVRSDSLLGLANKNQHLDFSETKARKLHFRDFNERTIFQEK